MRLPGAQPDHGNVAGKSRDHRRSADPSERAARGEREAAKPRRAAGEGVGQVEDVQGHGGPAGTVEPHEVLH